MTKYHPLKELSLARLREFLREPEAVFWTYGFRLLLAVGLGIAFRNRPVEKIYVDVAEHERATEIAQVLKQDPGMVVEVHGEQECRDHLRLGKSSLVVIPGAVVTYVFDPSRQESELAHQRVDDVLQRAAGRQDPLRIKEKLVTEPGARYIDFLVQISFHDIHLLPQLFSHPAGITHQKPDPDITFVNETRYEPLPYVPECTAHEGFPQ